MSENEPLNTTDDKGRAAQGGGAAGGGDEAYFKQELLTAVETGDMDEQRLSNALKHLSKEAINEAFPRSPYAALHLAAKNNFPKLVTALLKAGADSNIQDFSWKKYNPLHHATKNGHAEVVKALLEKGADPNAKEGEFGDTALHLLTNKWDTKEDSYKACLDALLSNDKTHGDILNIEKQSPIFLAASRGWEYMVEELIYKGANYKATYANETIEDLIKKKFPGLLASINTNAIVKPQRHLREELFKALICPNIELFREIMDEIEEDKLQSMKSVLENDHVHGKYTLLQYACEKGLTDFVKELLNHGADPSQEDKTNKMNPILHAARNGFYKILKLLLLALRNQDDPNTDFTKVRAALKKTDDRGETALHKVVKREYDNKGEGVDYSKCLELLLLDKKRLLDLDVQENFLKDMDEHKKFMDKEKCLVDLDAQDKYGFTALHHAVYFYDQSFVQKLLLNGSSLSIKNKFGTLAITSIQPMVLKKILNNCIESEKNVSDLNFEITLHYGMLAPKQTEMQSDMEIMRFLSDSRKHQRLLLHPVIDTLLFLKWQRIQKYYYFNILLYMAFLILLTAYILLFHGTFTHLTDDDPSEQNATASTSLPDPTKANVALKISLGVLIFICILYLIIREGIQISISWRRYVKSLKNWLEISIILLTCTVLLIPIIPVEMASQQSVCAWLVLFSWIEGMLVLGRHPYLSIYITMFTTVAKNFLKFIFMFSSMVVAFSISFYLVFQVNGYFTTYYNSLLKTIAMTTGEIGYTELPLDAFPISSHLLYVTFVFLIVLVLMNLLNGLAVSDIQKIQQEAEILSSRSRVEVISYIESVLPAKLLLKNFRESSQHCEGGEKDNRSFTPCLEQDNPIIKFLNRMGHCMRMFQTCLHRSPSITLYPNSSEKRWYICECGWFQLKEEQIEAAKDVVLEQVKKEEN